jgi:hypothetical protein
MVERSGVPVPQLSELEAIDLIEVGHHVYSRTRQTAREYPVGGLVWKVEPYADQETGRSASPVPRHPWRRRPVGVRHGRQRDVDTETLSPPRFDLIRGAIRSDAPASS